MEQVWLGRTGVRVSKLALGTMSFGGDADADEAKGLYRDARDAGVTLFDTADVYNKGRSEEILGGLIASERDALVLSTKAYFPTGRGPNDRGTSRYHLVRAVEASLRRLGTDRIDLFFLHRYDDQTPLEETLRGVEELVRAGKILYPAVSNFAAWQTMKALGIARARGWAEVVAMQPMFNLVKRTAEIELFPLAASEGLAVIPYSPLAGGLLTGKYRDVDAEGRIRDNAMYKVRYGDPEHFDRAAAFAALAEEAGVSPVTLAVAWTAAHPGVSAPLLGARSRSQLKPALAAAEYTLDPKLFAAVSALTKAPPPATDRNEETSSHNFGTR
ncbi:MAG: aldo/keto reductase [Myxococcota bacterium]